MNTCVHYSPTPIVPAPGKDAENCAAGPNPSGLCMCGCGQRTAIADQTCSSLGWVKGLPISYVDGHQNRRPDQTHIVQDCGYETPCWIWQGAQIRGYGRAGRAGLAHRVYFEKEHGPLPSGTQLHHLCEQRLCVNPAHLAPLVQSEHRRRHNRLSDADVLAIREHAAAGARVVDIAGAYEISATGVTRIIHGSTYRHVGGPLVTTELRGLRRDTRRISREADEL